MTSETRRSREAADEVVSDPSRWSAREVDRHYRKIQESPRGESLRALFLGNHTLDGLMRRVVVLGHSQGFTVEARLGPFDQYFQTVLDPHSDIDSFDPHVIVLTLSLRRLAPKLATALAASTAAESSHEIRRVLDTILEWTSAAKQRTGGTILITNFWRPAQPHLGLADGRNEMGEAEVYATLNLELAKQFRQDPQVQVVDVDHAVARAGRADAWDPRMYYLAKMEWSQAALAEVSGLLTRYLRSLVIAPRKCVIVDLDNTLWGGIAGEDGPEGIRVSEGDPIGEAHRAFQSVLKALKQRGTVLAICSKNNLADAKEVFELRQDMPLSWDDFAASRINWEPKHQNLRALAEELNLGLDSLVFLDDSPAERELIRQMLPEVATIPLPDDPALYPGILLESQLFDQLTVTAEDARKTEMYRENARREESRTKMGDLESYLESLDTRLEIRSADESDLNRVHQLFSKTNQFNLTTRRYRPSELERFMRESDWRLAVVSAADRWGDLGIIGTFLLHEEEDVLRIDSFMLSCRAMGRGIDGAMCNYIKRVAAEVGVEAIRGSFVPTKKNAPAADFYARQGFAEVDGGEGVEGSRRDYVLLTSEAEELSCPGITVRA